MNRIPNRIAPAEAPPPSTYYPDVSLDRFAAERFEATHQVPYSASYPENDGFSQNLHAKTFETSYSSYPKNDGFSANIHSSFAVSGNNMGDSYGEVRMTRYGEPRTPALERPVGGGGDKFFQRRFEPSLPPSFESAVRPAMFGYRADDPRSPAGRNDRQEANAGSYSVFDQDEPAEYGRPPGRMAMDVFGAAVSPERPNYRRPAFEDPRQGQQPFDDRSAHRMRLQTASQAAGYINTPSPYNAEMQSAMSIFGSAPPADFFGGGGAVARRRAPLLGSVMDVGGGGGGIFDRHLRSFVDATGGDADEQEKSWSVFRSSLLNEQQQRPSLLDSIDLETEEDIARRKEREERRRKAEEEEALYRFDPDSLDGPKKFRQYYDGSVTLALFDKAFENCIWENDPKFKDDYLPHTKRGHDRSRRGFVSGETYIHEEFKWKKWEGQVEKVWKSDFVPKVRERQAYIEAGLEHPDDIAKREKQNKLPQDVALLDYFDKEIGFDESLCSLDYCGLCDVGFQSVLPSITHYTSEKHEKFVRNHIIHTFYDSGKIEDDDLDKQWFDNLIRRILKKLKWKPTDYKCTVCDDIELTSLAMARSHFKGSQHQNRVRGLPVVKSLPPHQAREYMNQCVACNVQLNNKREMELHCQSMAHIINVRACADRNVALPPGPSARIAPTKTAKANYKIAKKFATKQGSASATSANTEPLGTGGGGQATGGGNDAADAYSCAICRKRFYNDAQYRMHVESQQHLDREYKTARLAIKGKSMYGEPQSKRARHTQQPAAAYASSFVSGSELTIASLGVVAGGPVGYTSFSNTPSATADVQGYTSFSSTPSATGYATADVQPKPSAAAAYNTGAAHSKPTPPSASGYKTGAAPYGKPPSATAYNASAKSATGYSAGTPSAASYNAGAKSATSYNIGAKSATSYNTGTATGYSPSRGGATGYNAGSTSATVYNSGATSATSYNLGAKSAGATAYNTGAAAQRRQQPKPPQKQQWLQAGAAQNARFNS